MTDSTSAEPTTLLYRFLEAYGAWRDARDAAHKQLVHTTNESATSTVNSAKAETFIQSLDHALSTMHQCVHALQEHYHAAQDPLSRAALADTYVASQEVGDMLEAESQLLEVTLRELATPTPTPEHKETIRAIWKCEPYIIPETLERHLHRMRAMVQTFQTLQR
ncbi:hypothetical protein IWQ61_009586 [Dispira simplex]|nr:hypothetical protein IWQ61_009586 [Dispira simplex]